jgi:hypothetical protein
MVRAVVTVLVVLIAAAESPPPEEAPSSSPDAPAAAAEVKAVPPPAAPESTVLPRPADQPTGTSAIVLRGGRVALESVIGAGLGALGLVAFGYVGVLVDQLGGRDSGPALQIGAALGATFGVAPGVWLGGKALGGDGLLGWTLVGSAVGTAASAAVLAIRQNAFTLTLGALFPLIGAVLGYELSSHTKKPPEETPKLTIAPALSPTSAGVVGTF